MNSLSVAQFPQHVLAIIDFVLLILQSFYSQLSVTRLAISLNSFQIQPRGKVTLNIAYSHFARD